MRVNPKLLWLLVAVIAYAVATRLANPHRKYSTRQYWESATVAQVADVPQKALLPGNKNGPNLDKGGEKGKSGMSDFA